MILSFVKSFDLKIYCLYWIYQLSEQRMAFYETYNHLVNLTVESNQWEILKDQSYFAQTYADKSEIGLGHMGLWADCFLKLFWDEICEIKLWLSKVAPIYFSNLQ